MRPELEPLPERMKALLVDERGYPVPWFVDYLDGKPEFRAMDLEKFACAVREKRCWVCGGKLGVHVVFVVGPMCGINRVSSEPPSHEECARWSVRNCPFLSNPTMVRREDGIVNNAMLQKAAGIALARNPGVGLLWFTRQYEVFRDGLPKEPDRNHFLFQMGEPTKVEWWCERRIATREEVLRSVTSGLPSLEIAARQEPGGLVALQEARQRFEKFLPGE